MEAYGVIRVISLAVVWGIPAVLVLGLAVFIVLATLFTFGGMASRLHGITIGQKKTGLVAHAQA